MTIVKNALDSVKMINTIKTIVIKTRKKILRSDFVFDEEISTNYEQSEMIYIHLRGK